MRRNPLRRISLTRILGHYNFMGPKNTSSEGCHRPAIPRPNGPQRWQKNRQQKHHRRASSKKNKTIPSTISETLCNPATIALCIRVDTDAAGGTNCVLYSSVSL